MARIASSLYEGRFGNVDALEPPASVVEPALNQIKLNNNLATTVTSNHRSREEWESIFAKSAFFDGSDTKLGYILAMVYEDPESYKISTILFSALGELCMNSLTLNNKSRFFSACENLKPEYKDSNVRRAIAITLLRAFSVYGHVDLSQISRYSSSYQLDWDETTAGAVASDMNVISSKTPAELGKQLLTAGFLQPHFLDSTRLDVIYEDSPPVIESNNKLVFLIGQQLEHLFDTLTEYSPESPNTLYKAPDSAPKVDTDLVKSICNELFQLQENITTQLVQFLKEVVIPIRIKALNGELPVLSASNVNKIFPPTLDEITRVNCMFLEALKSAMPFGSFELVRACAITIPYFYKAYMRHESAIKSFSPALNEFLQFYGLSVPSNYSPPKIESIMKVQLNLPKIKLIVERLVDSVPWSHTEAQEVKKLSKGIMDIIESFGKDEPKPYNRRVFTPTGKILTEICEGWPSVLAYGWLNRKVISVVDFKRVGSEGVIILFNDYIVFAEIDSDYPDDDNSYKPHISDLLMNSLINENPIKKIPNLKVLTWTDLNSVEVSCFEGEGLSFIMKNEPELVLNMTVKDPSKFLNLLNKAKILSKSTPFHLFKNEKFGLTIYATAHEKTLYDREHSRSNISLFLNIAIDEELLRKYDLFAGMSAKFVDENMIQITVLTQNGETFTHTINKSELASFVSEELSSLETRRRTSQNVRLFPSLALNYRSLLQDVVAVQEHVKPQVLQVSRKSSVNVKRLSSLSSVDTNKPLPKIVDRDITPTSQLRKEPAKRQSKFRNRLSMLFGLKKMSSPSVVEKKNPPIKTVQDKLDRQGIKRVVITKHPQIPVQPIKNSLYKDETPEVSTFDDCKTFESSMSAIFDDEEERALNTKPLAGHNWTITRENSSVNSNLDKHTQLMNYGGQSENPSSIKRAVTLFGPTRNSSESSLLVDKQIATKENPIAQISSPTIQDAITQSIVNAEFSREFSNGVQRDETFNTMDDFHSPLLKIEINRYDVRESEIDAFYTPKSHSTDFVRFEDSSEVSDHDHEYSFEQVDNKTIKLEEGVVNTSVKLENDKEYESYNQGDSGSFSSGASFKSCLNEKELKLEGFMGVDDVNEGNDELIRDESFKYLADMLNNPVLEQVLKNSDTYRSLPRSYSSYKYLATFIDSDLSMSSDLYNFLQDN